MLIGILLGIWLVVAVVLAALIQRVPGASGGSWLYSILASLFWPLAVILAIYDWVRNRIT